MPFLQQESLILDDQPLNPPQFWRSESKYIRYGPDTSTVGTLPVSPEMTARFPWAAVSLGNLRSGTASDAILTELAPLRLREVDVGSKP